MALPQPIFVRDEITDEYKLTERAKKVLKDILQAQELSRFMDLVGYTPNPEGPWPPRPWPWPGPWPFRNSADLQVAGLGGGSGLGYPNSDDDGPWPWPIGPLVKELMGELLLDKIAKAPAKKGSLSLIDAMKREGVATEAFGELSDKLSQFQKTLSTKMKASA